MKLEKYLLAKTLVLARVIFLDNLLDYCLAVSAIFIGGSQAVDARHASRSLPN